MEHIGDATLYLGDAKEIAPTLNGVSCVVSSPPYNTLDRIPKIPTGLWASSDAGSGFVRALASSAYPDGLEEADYQRRQNLLFEAIAGACLPTASLFYNHQLRWREKKCLHPVDWFRPLDWRLRQEIVWDRGGGMMFGARMFCRFDERILWFTRSDTWKWNQASVGDGTVWRIAREQNKEHPVAFPEAVPRRCIRAVTDEDDLVLDPFMGGGTTGIAALRLCRKFVGIEINERWFDSACRRIEHEARQPRLFDRVRPAQAALLLSPLTGRVSPGSGSNTDTTHKINGLSDD